MKRILSFLLTIVLLLQLLRLVPLVPKEKLLSLKPSIIRTGVMLLFQ